MAVASPADVEMHLVQSRVHERLFGAGSRSVAIGRFTVLGPLGAGGMGVVFAAHDPELDRKVAIKLVATGRTGSSSSSQSRLLGEAQTMARLSHPNIVTVHEVGTHEGGVYLAMEYIDGETLAAWRVRSQPSWSRIVEVFVQAGQGLAAAHRDGVVHRDFKPNNVMIDRTGRVRVLDFGLAIDRHGSRELAITQSSGRERSVQSIGGTLLYMAPEQRAGASASTATDQYAFCVSLWSALYGRHPFAGVDDGSLDAPAPLVPAGARVPGWLRRVLERGLGPAAARWPTMDALVDALARGRTNARRRRVAAGLVGVAAIGLGVFVTFELDERRRMAACERAGASIEDVWSDETRASTRTALLSTGASYAEVTADKVMPRIDAHADAWRAARTEACVAADLHARWDADTLDRSLWCLDAQRTELEVFARDLVDSPRVVQTAVVTAASLGKPASCLDVDRLRRLPAPPVTHREEVRAVQLELARADAIARGGKYGEALEVVRAAQVRASGIDWAPLFSTAKRREASLLERQGDYEGAEHAAREAFFDAARVGAWETASTVAIDLAHLLGVRTTRHADALDWVRHAEVADAHAGDPLGLKLARRSSSESSVRFAMADYAGARAPMERARDILEVVHGPDHPIVANALGNLATLYESTGETVRARELHERVLAIREDALGPEHPDVASTLNSLADALHSSGDAAGATAAYERALQIRERALGPDHPAVAKSMSMLAVMIAADDPARARELQTRALAVMEAAVGERHRDVAIVLLNLGALELTTGHPEAARAHYERALAIHEEAGNAHHPVVAQTLANLAEVHLALHERGKAVAALERALAIFGESEGMQDGELDARISLAKAITPAP